MLSHVCNFISSDWGLGITDVEYISDPVTVLYLS